MDAPEALSLLEQENFLGHHLRLSDAGYGQHSFFN